MEEEKESVETREVKGRWKRMEKRKNRRKGETRRLLRRKSLSNYNNGNNGDS